MTDYAPLNPSGKKMGEFITLDEILPFFKSFKLRKPFVFLVGGLVANKRTEGDIDVLIKRKEDTDDKSLEFRIMRMFPEKYWKRLHFCYDDRQFGPFTDFVPLYDLTLEVQDDFKIEKMSDRINLGFIKIGIPFQPLKAATGYRQYEFFDFDEMYEQWAKPRFEQSKKIAVEEKFDGMRMVIHKKGDDIRIFTEDEKRDRAKCFPHSLIDIRKLPDGVYDSEMVEWAPNFMQPLKRESMIKFIVGKEQTDDEWVQFNVFDVVNSEGNDIHGEPWSKRQEFLRRAIPNDTQHLNRVNPIIAGDQKELRDAFDKLSKEKGSEGVMLKEANGIYELTGRTEMWAKLKNVVEIAVQVIDKILKKPAPGAKESETWIYVVGVLRKDGKGLIPIGKTYTTNIDIKPGDIMTVTPAKTRVYRDQQGDIRVSWMFPRVKHANPERTQPDTFEQVVKAAKASGEYELHELQADPFMFIPKEDGTYNFVVQNHFRGKSVHKDLRMESNDFLVGWTMASQIEGALKEPVETLDEAKKLDKHSADWDKFFSSKFDPNTKIVSFKKSAQPKEWLTMEGVIRPGQIGATKENEGVLDIFDKGEVEFLTQKPYFHEYYLHGRDFNGIFVFRQLENVWAKSPEQTKTGREGTVWMTWRTLEEHLPYVITSRAREEGWVPPQGHSALPRKIRELVPPEFQYWKFEDEGKRRASRDALYDNIKSGAVKLAQDSMHHTFSFQHQWWKGQTVIRAGPSMEQWNIRIDRKEDGGLLNFAMDSNPLEVDSTTSVKKGDSTEEDMKAEGEMKPKTKLNPTKNTPSFIEILDSGEVTVLEDIIGFMKFIFNGEKLKGNWAAVQEEKGSNIWIFKKSELPPVK
jgi:hypothetical protein